MGGEGYPPYTDRVKINVTTLAKVTKFSDIKYPGWGFVVLYFQGVLNPTGGTKIDPLSRWGSSIQVGNEILGGAWHAATNYTLFFISNTFISNTRLKFWNK